MVKVRITVWGGVSLKANKWRRSPGLKYASDYITFWEDVKVVKATVSGRSRVCRFRMQFSRVWVLPSLKVSVF